MASRREADKLIEEGRVRINKRTVLELGSKVDDRLDIVEVDGKRVRKREEKVYLLLYKPQGTLVTQKDPFGRPTARDLLPPSLGRVFSVGRLDFESQGLLLLTTDGELAQRLSHPRYEVKKVYLAKVLGRPDKASLLRLERGIFLDGRKTAPARVRLLEQKPDCSHLQIEVHEGRKREVRRMCQSVGHPVVELKRIGFAGLTLKGLKPGGWRFLEPREVRRLKKLTGLEED